MIKSCDVAVWVVPATLGPTGADVELFRLLSAYDKPIAAAVLNRCDQYDDASYLELVEMSIEDLLREQFYESTQIVHTSAAQACESPEDKDLSGSGKEYWEDKIAELITVLDSFDPE